MHIFYRLHFYLFFLINVLITYRVCLRSMIDTIQKRQNGVFSEQLNNKSYFTDLPVLSLRAGATGNVHST